MNLTEYWNQEWGKRIALGKVPAMNRDKMAKLVYELSRRDGLDNLEKLDIGCGTGIHAMILAGFNGGWNRKWTGIDLSNAVRFCQRHGFNAILGDFFTHKFDRKFECFLMLDSLEHFLDHEAVAKRILELAEDKFCIFINVPLYCQAHAAQAGAERIVTTEDVDVFFRNLNIKHENTNVEVYGSYGFPYMIAEGWK